MIHSRNISSETCVPYTETPMHTATIQVGNEPLLSDANNPKPADKPKAHSIAGIIQEQRRRRAEWKALSFQQRLKVRGKRLLIQILKAIIAVIFVTIIATLQNNT